MICGDWEKEHPLTVDLSTGLSVDEYLDRNFDPECELLGGETRPKPLGRLTHSMTEKRLLERFYGERRVQFELSVIIDGDIVIPDVLVLASDRPATHRDVLDEPPLLCVEVLSPAQRPAEMMAMCERYRDFGVPFCWVVDPVGRRAWEYNSGQAAFCEVMEMFSGPCAVGIGDLFAE
jgi:Uma2 family endonuclease